MTVRHVEVVMSTPISFHVGTSANSPGRRRGDEITSSRILPCCRCSAMFESPVLRISMCPPSSAIVLWPPPAKLTILSLFTSTPPRLKPVTSEVKLAPATPDVPSASASGAFRMRSSISRADWIGEAVRTLTP